eukprot:g64178.t1
MLPEVPPFHLELLSILMLALTLAVAVLPFNISATVGLANRPATWPAEATKSLSKPCQSTKVASCVDPTTVSSMNLSNLKVYKLAFAVRFPVSSVSCGLKFEVGGDG